MPTIGGGSNKGAGDSSNKKNAISSKSSVTADKIKQRFGGSGAVLTPNAITSSKDIKSQNLTEIEQVIQAGGKVSSEPVREVRSVYDLEPGRYQNMLRNMDQVTDEGSDEFQALLESIRTYGFQGELLVSKNDKIYSGNRRWAVLKWLHENEGWSEFVPVRLVEIFDRDELSFMTRFNSTSQQLTKEAIASIVSHYVGQGETIRDIVRKTGFSKHDVTQATAIAKLPIEVQRAIDEKGFQSQMPLHLNSKKW
jgi:hypothetical protein